ncbi:hypothetical protein QA601_17825, partial [Chitinispirillales bacterium ANBcel5]|nr:hypothetical protein [Chitinispirillales bacterium ANBcel5]
MKKFLLGLLISPVVTVVIILCFVYLGPVIGFSTIVSTVVGYYIYSNYRKVDGMFCLDCGIKGPVKQKPRGSGLIELILWLFILVPGIIYTVWRGQKKEYKCPSCGGNNIVSETSISAKEYLEK